MKIFRTMLKAILVATGFLSFMTTPGAAQSGIVVLGASNAVGYGGTGTEAAWPAQLEQMLRQKGYDVSISVSATPGHTSRETLARTSYAIPQGTRVVIFSAYRYNDRRKGVPPQETAANFAQIAQNIRQAGATPIKLTTFPAQYALPGDQNHLSPEGHTVIARTLLPQVIAALRR